MKEEWLYRYSLAKDYYEEYGNLLIPISYEVKDKYGENYKLGNWISRQRVYYNNREKYGFEQDKIDLLNKIGMKWSIYNIDENISDDWFKVYYWVKDYYEKNGNLDLKANSIVQLDNKTINPYTWLLRQRANYQKGTLKSKQIELLKKIGFNFNLNHYKGMITDGWMEKYNLSKEYYNKNGNLNIKANYIIYKNNEEILLGLWIVNQRRSNNRNKLNQTKKELLDKIGMIWDPRNDKQLEEDNWMSFYDEVNKYFIFNKDINNINDNLYLKNWINVQKRLYAKNDLEEYKIKLLEKLNIIWNKNLDNTYISDKFMEKYLLAKKYYEEHGNLLIPSSLVVKSNNDEYIKLGGWINYLRRKYKEKELSNKKIDLLNEIEMIWNVRNNKELEEERWNYVYNLLKDLYLKYGELSIDKDTSYENQNGESRNLYSWINIQRQRYNEGTLEKEKIRLLESVGVKFKDTKRFYKISSIWLKKYEEAKKYYKEHGNLFIPYDYVVYNDEKELELGDWLNKQRYYMKKDRLSSKKILLLNEIGMTWELINNESYIKDKWLINYELVKKYYEEHGNLFVSINYEVVENGIKYKLGSWLAKQRKAYKNGTLNKNKEILLNDIDMIWDINLYRENKKYIDKKYLDYCLGTLNERQIKELVGKNVFRYSDNLKIQKGNPLKLIK